VDLLPWKTAEGWTSLLELTRPIAKPWRAVFSDGVNQKTFTFLPAVRRCSFAPLAWGFHPTRLVVQGARTELSPELSEVRVRAVEAGAPLPADPPTLLAWPPENWRDGRREWFHWAGTSVLVLVTSNYQVQDSYLKRLAFFVEKAGYRGRLVTDREVAALHAWNAHDYAAADLARFFTLAAQSGFPLNASERELRSRLEGSGILVADGTQGWKPGTGALVAVSAESPLPLRTVLFVHEAFHGLYFTTQGFRTGVKAAWESLSDGAREAFRTYLSHSRYDREDEGLMVNEFQAYVLQRPASDWETFFRDRVLSGTTESARLSWMTEYLDAARQLDTLVQGLYGFSSGNVALVTVF